MGPDGCDRRHRRGLRHALGLRPGRRVARAGSEERRHDGQDQCVAEAVHRLAAYLTGGGHLPRRRERRTERPARDPCGFRARVQAPVAAESDAGLRVVEAVLAERGLDARVAPAVGIRNERARQRPADVLGEAVEQRALHRVRRLVERCARPVGRRVQHEGVARLAPGLAAVARIPGQDPVAARIPRPARRGARASKATSAAQQGAIGTARDARGERRAGTRERGGRRRRQRERDGGVSPCARGRGRRAVPSRGVRVRCARSARRTRRRGPAARNRGSEFIAGTPTHRSPGRSRSGQSRLPAAARRRRLPRASSTRTNPGIRRRQVLRAMVEARRREAARREAPARRALRLEHARVHAGLGEAPRAGEPASPAPITATETAFMLASGFDAKFNDSPRSDRGHGARGLRDAAVVILPGGYRGPSRDLRQSDALLRRSVRLQLRRAAAPGPCAGDRRREDAGVRFPERAVALRGVRAAGPVVALSHPREERLRPQGRRQGRRVLSRSSRSSTTPTSSCT